MLFNSVTSFRHRGSNPLESATSYGGSLLHEDDSMLRKVFLSVLRHHHAELAPKIDVIFALSEAWCLSESDEDFKRLGDTLEALAPEELILVRRTILMCPTMLDTQP